MSLYLSLHIHASNNKSIDREARGDVVQAQHELQRRRQLLLGLVRGQVQPACCWFGLNRLRVRLQTESSKHQPMRYGYALIEAGVGARVAQVLTARALDIEAPELPVV